MKVAIVGAGVSGLAAARALRAAGFDVAVFEERADVGGVWSASRRYPGVKTQNDKRTYSFSDLPMPDDYDEFPSGAAVQAYLAEFARVNGLDKVIELGTRVVFAERTAGEEGWDLDLEGPGGARREHADWLVMANGICSLPHVPEYPGAEAFIANGGLVLAPSEVGDGDRLRGRDVVVVGWGKSAADIALAAIPLARSVTVVARGISWKLPWRIGGMAWQRLVLSRLGEHLIWAPHRTIVGRVLQRLDRGARIRLLRALERKVRTQLELDRRGLVPEDGIDGFTHLVTDGFFEAIDSGAIRLARGTRVTALEAAQAGGRAVLADGSTLPVDVVVAATGYDQDLSFLSDGVRATLLDPHGDLHLYLHTLPRQPSRIAFLGWMNSFRSPIGAEMQALWLTALLLGKVTPPDARAWGARTKSYRLTHEAAGARRLAQFSSGASILDIDQWLSEAGLRVPMRTRLGEVLRPLDPASYRGLLDRLVAGARAPERPDRVSA